MAVYTQTLFKNIVWDATLDADITSALTVQTILNNAVREVLSEVDLRSTKRKALITQKLFDDIHFYTCPTDLKDRAIIDIQVQANRLSGDKPYLVDEPYFDRWKGNTSKTLISVSDDDLTRKLLVNKDVNDDTTTIAQLNSLTGDGGTWALFGDAENVAADTDNYIQGGGSIKFDISSAGGTTAGIQNSDIDTFDITDYVNNGSVFVWVYINSVTDTGSDGLTNFIIRVGNDSSNYYSQTITTNNEGAAFYAGWNLLRFDFASMSQTGTVDPDACDYVALYMTKEVGKVDNGYRFDNLVLQLGEYHNILYYSKYGWQNSSGTWIENSSAATDYVNADTDEIDLFAAKAKKLGYEFLRMYDIARVHADDYLMKRRRYKKRYPSERLGLLRLWA